MPPNTYNVSSYREQGTGAWVENSGFGAIRRAVGTLAATGSAQGDAAAITQAVTTVTASDGTKGVVLPTPIGGEELIVVNTVSAQNLKIYPAGSGIINFAAASAALVLAGQKTIRLVATSPTQWFGILSA